MAYLPEVPEAQAQGDVAFVYGEIRRLSAVPMVAQIWRHLATLPGALEGAWAMVAPLMESGRVQEAAWRVADALVAEPLPPMPAAALAVAGVDAAGIDAIGRVLDAYNRANPVNLLAVSALAVRLGDRQAVAHRGECPPWTPPVAVPPLPPIVTMEDMTPAVRTVVEALGCRDPARAERVVPSLYRHLPPWPGYLALLHVVLMPRFADGSIERAVRAVRAAMQRQAVVLAGAMERDPRLAASRGATEAFARFSEIIPEMIVVGTLARRAVAA